MSRLFSIRPAYCLFVTSLFVLGGCQTPQNGGDLFSSGADLSPSPGVERSEDILNADGEIAILDDERALSPIEQHMLARKDVNPKKINRKNKFSKTVEDYKKHEADHSRTVRVDGDAEHLADAALEINADPIKKQAEAKSYVERVLEKHKARQAELDGSVDEAAPKNAVKAKVAPKAPEKNKKSVTQRDIRVSNVRIGQHPGKTRIVIDVSDKARFQTSFEDGGKVLVVKMPDAAWNADAEVNVVGQSLVRGYNAKQSGGGSVVKITLGSAGKLAYQKALKPSGERGNRIVLDVVAR